MAGDSRGRICRLERQHKNRDRSNVAMTVRIAKSYLSKNRIGPQEVGPLIEQVSLALAHLRRRPHNASGQQLPTQEEIQASIHERHLISFEDGKSYHMLKRHLTKLGLTPEAYRARWGLPDDYPMVAPFYTRKRARLAKRTRLGHYDREAGKLLPEDQTKSPEPRGSGVRRRQGAAAALKAKAPVAPAVPAPVFVASDRPRRQAAPRRLTAKEIAASIQDTFLICFEDGEPYRMLSRHLRLFGLTPDAYRAKWGLPDDYPMMPASDLRHRAELARQRKLWQYDRSNAKPRGQYVRKAKPSAQGAGIPAEPKATGTDRFRSGGRRQGGGTQAASPG
jgi:predicted transcriptional regulator